LSLLKAVVGASSFLGKGGVVACAYGDFERAGTLDPLLLPELAAKAGARVAMLDTAVKDGKPLTSFLSLSQLEEFSERAHSLGLLVALSGSLREEEIVELKGLADVVGVRGAACPSGRGGRISRELVRKLKGLLGGPLLEVSRR
ncbi:MAG: (5-formylfuran-3-yl)methyl phosphate synthase, partial [Candidatus Hadarchaeales archaeon]